MTGITLPGHSGSGFQDYGRKTVPEMIAALRRIAEHQKAEAEAILAASDDDFRVSTYIGSLVERNREVMQEGRKKP